MLKNILNIEGAQELSSKAQKAIKGGLKDCIDPMTGLCKYYSLACANPCRFYLEP